MLHKWLTEASKTRGSAKALVYRDTYLSWRGLQHRVERRVQEFLAMGINRGHWVGLMLGNVPDFAILSLALSKIGATVVPLDPTTGSRDLALILDHAPLRALITRPRGGMDPQAAEAQEKKTTRVDGLESRRRLQGTLLTCSIFKAPAKDFPHKAAVVLFTNDSSGDPKGVLRTDENLDAAATNLKTALEVTPEDRILTTVPLYHAYGFDFGLVLALKYGATLYHEDEVAPKRIVKLLREQEIDLLPGTPQLYAGLAKLPTAKALKIKRARYLSGGSALPEATAEAFKSRWSVRLIPVYHTTEASAIAMDRKGGVADTVGKVVDGVEVKLGESRANGAPLWVKGKTVARHAVGSSQRPREGEAAVGSSDAHGWLRTGDLATMDKAGRIFLVGREDQLVKVDGKRVALGEVESCLEQFPKVQQAQVRLITDPLGGPIMVANVVATSKCAPEEIIDHCAKNLAPYKVPRRIVFCESLPG